MEAWIRNHEAEHSIELRLKEIEPNRGKKNHWLAKHIFICARMGTGGASKYVPKHPERERKIQSKRMPCPCRLVAKSYPNTTTVLGRYENTHSHDTGSDNLIYTRIPAAALYKIEKDLRDGVRPDVVLKRARGGVHSEVNSPKLIAHGPRHEEFITQRDVHRIQKKIEAETIRLDPQDSRSTLHWVKHLEAIRAFTFFKVSCDPPPVDSDIDSDAFVLAFQTPYQQKCFRAWGQDFAGIDTTIIALTTVACYFSPTLSATAMAMACQ
ncbi:hypothetical protein DFH09DRAFT_1330856 [Mycena vulgaris]|nr:hypothetical protein DFH09DRAFT_1330856 [Mycena vulgaris]